MASINFKEFLCNFSISPIEKAARAKSCLLVLIWLSILITSFGITCFQVTNLILKLHAGNKIAQPIIVDSNELNFPAVTFCNLNPYKKSAVSSLKIFNVLGNISNNVGEAIRRKCFSPDDTVKYENRSLERFYERKSINKRQAGECPTIDTNQTYRIRNKHSNRCIDAVVEGNYQSDCSKTANYGQTMIFYPEISQTSPQYFYIMQQISNKVFTRLDNNQLVLADPVCNASEQLFRFEANISDCTSKRLVTSISNMYVTSNADTDYVYDSTFLNAYQHGTLNDTGRQEWSLETADSLFVGALPIGFTFSSTPSPCEPNPNKFYKIVHKNSSLVFTVTNGTALNGTTFSLTSSNGSFLEDSTIKLEKDRNETNQHWYFQKLFNPIRYSIMNRRSGMFMSWLNNTGWVGQQCIRNNSKTFRLINDNGMCMFKSYSADNYTDQYIIPYNYALNASLNLDVKYYPINDTKHFDAEHFILIDAGLIVNSQTLQQCNMETTTIRSSSTTTTMITTTTSTSKTSATSSTGKSSTTSTSKTSTTSKFTKSTTSKDVENLSSTNNISASTSKTSMIPISVFNLTSGTTRTEKQIISTPDDLTNILNSRIEDMEPAEINNVLNIELNSDATSQQTTLQASLPYFLSSLTEKERMSLGYQKSDVMQYCSFNGIKCEEPDITQWNDLISGNCFTFNHKTSPNRHITHHPGSQHGLKIFFNVMSNEYLPMAMSSGVKIIIHDPNVTIFTDVEGDVLSGSNVAQFSLNYQEIQRKTTDCIMESNQSNNFYTNEYSYESCIRACYQRRIIEICGCADPGVAIENLIPQIQRYCSVKEMSCVQNIYDTIADVRFYCSSCQLPCKEKLYEITKTVSQLKLNIISNNNHSTRDVVAVDVYFRSLSYIVLVDDYEYIVNNFLSDLGGIVGANFDASFISIFEVSLLLLILAARFIKII